MAEELLYKSAYTRVVRVHRDAAGGPARADGHACEAAGLIICKQSLGKGAVERSRHEAAILGRLTGVPGVPSLASVPGSDLAGAPNPAGRSTPADAIFLEDVGGESLAALLARGPLGADEVLALAEDLAGIVAAVHHHGVLHKDINPSNILVYGPSRQLMLIDFDLASTLVEERPDFTEYTAIVGTLAYIAPEQTGRTGWAVDQRADLYALGSTLYELATGVPPFGADSDPLRLTHDQLAQVPVPPREINPALCGDLSDLIMRLLEKDPDWRYQGADGLLYDIRRIREDLRPTDSKSPAIGAASRKPLILGQRDFPERLPPPVHLVGRDPQLATLACELRDVSAGKSRVVLVSGQPGVGKTALVNALRPMATAADGWFLYGKFDQYRSDPDTCAIAQVLHATAGMLLAQAEFDIEALRTRLGVNAGLLAALEPRLGTLLGVTPEGPSGDPTKVRSRLNQIGQTLLMAIDTPERPVVLVLDDLQWADSVTLDLVDTIVDLGHLHHVLVVCAYRESELGAHHPLRSIVRKWREHPNQPHHLRLDNLPPEDERTLVAAMLRQPEATVAPLADAVFEQTSGNPFATVELVNALRRDGTLELTAQGWRWDTRALRHYVRPQDVVGRLSLHVAELPDRSREVLETLACLGGAVELDLLRVATCPHAPCAGPGPPGDLALWDPAVAGEGFLSTRYGPPTSIQFRHDWIEQAVYLSMPTSVRRARQLAIARSLRPHARFAAPAAQQYLAVVDALTDSSERRQAIRLFRIAVERARLVADYELVDRYLAAAIGLLDSLATHETEAAADRQLRLDLALERHVALHVLGRFAAVDELYGWIRASTDDPLVRAKAAQVQIASLVNREQVWDALALGLETLAELGHPAPTGAELSATIDDGLDHLVEWTAARDETSAQRLTDQTRARFRAVGRIIDRLIVTAFVCQSEASPWLVVEAGRLWRTGGPDRALVGALAHTALVTVRLRQDYVVARQVAGQVLRVAEDREFEPEASEARFLMAVTTGAWCESLEETIRQMRRAREGLIQGGDLQFAAYSYLSTILLFDCAPTLDEVLLKIEEGLALSERTGNSYIASFLVAYLQAARALRGETTGPGYLDDAAFNEAQHLISLRDNPGALAYLHIAGALVAVVLADRTELHRQVTAALPLLPIMETNYCIAALYIAWGLDLVEQARDAGPADQDAYLRQLDECREWLTRRAADAPDNMLHLKWLLDAEHASLVGELDQAATCFDHAQREVSTRTRPWHQALIAERLARFRFSRDREHSGREALRAAVRGYREWGATRKVDQLGREFPFLLTDGNAALGGTGSGLGAGGESGDESYLANLSSRTVDTLGILRASQALSSETNLTSLRRRVSEVLGALTGATTVTVAIRDHDTNAWLVPHPGGDGDLTIAAAAEQSLIPITAFRYAERTGEPLVVDDALRDDRFGRDPYLRSRGARSLLVVPIRVRGELRAMLILENRHGRAAFGANRLDTVMLITGQLSVSLDNALLYTDLEHKVASRTEALRAANEQLAALAATDPLTGTANRRQLTSILDLEWAHSLHTHSPISLAMIDIDHFKSYNDQYGHQAGDACLRRVAAAIGQNIRSTDLLARYGGEEFAIIFPHADLLLARKVAERVRLAVASLAIPHSCSSRGIVTVSVGLAAAVATSQSSPGQLVSDADARLYQAKRAGRDRVSGGEALSLQSLAAGPSQRPEPGA